MKINLEKQKELTTADFMKNLYMKNEDSFGILGHLKEENNGQFKYNHTDKFVIIGGSGSGKSSLFCNLATFLIKNFSHVVIVSPTAKGDENLTAFCALLKSVNIPSIIVSISKDGNIVLPELKNALLLIDDLQGDNSTKHKVVDKLVQYAFQKGRHNATSIVYICHTPKWIPSVLKSCATGVFIDRFYDNIPISEKIEGKNSWYHLNNWPGDVITKIKFDNLSRQEFLNRLKSKKFKEDENKTLPNLEVKYGIKSAGNESKELEMEIAKEIKVCKGKGLDEKEEKEKQMNGYPKQITPDFLEFLKNRKHYK